MDEMNALEQKIGYTFSDHKLLRRALTHSSYANEKNARANEKNAHANEKNAHANEKSSHWGGADPQTDDKSCRYDADSYVAHNEMLEFLGDSILGFIIAEALFLRKPDDGEGRLSQMRATIVRESSLALCANELGIGGYMRFGNNMPEGQSRRLDSILSDAMEAVFAAVYLDGGIAAARGVIIRCMETIIGEALTQEGSIDSKTRLQEYFFKIDKNVKIVYTVTAESGPAHKRRFTSQVAVNGRAMGSGEGGTKKESEQNAAKEALNNI